MKNNFKRAEYNIRGLVQGVGFRYFVYRNAVKLGLFGYTKNLYDGSVEVVAEGREDKLNELLMILKAGPSRSYVEDVRVEYGEYSGSFKGFGID
jgi:acylphosphatase